MSTMPALLRCPNEAAFPWRVPSSPVARPAPDFSAIEWLVIELARHDSVSSVRSPSRIGRFFGGLFGLKTVNRLADARLESLRRVAVYGWRRDGRIPDEEVDAFLAAGFSFDQMMLVFSTIRARRLNYLDETRRAPGRAFDFQLRCGRGFARTFST